MRGFELNIFLAKLPRQFPFQVERFHGKSDSTAKYSSNLIKRAAERRHGPVDRPGRNRTRARQRQDADQRYPFGPSVCPSPSVRSVRWSGSPPPCLWLDETSRDGFYSPMQSLLLSPFTFWFVFHFVRLSFYPATPRRCHRRCRLFAPARYIDLQGSVRPA